VTLGATLRSPAKVTDIGEVTDLAVVAGLTPEWVCVGCRARVPMSENVCTECGRPFGEGLALDSPAKRRDRGRWALVVRELIVLNILFILWRVVGRVSLFHEAGAFSRGHDIWNLERTLRLPSEAAMQRAILPHATVSRILNGYYSYAHATLLAATLIWLLWRHRDQYARWRNLIVVFTGVALLLGFIPVAPPRLIPSLHMVDLADRYHQSVYSSLGHGITDQLSSVPSVHVGWAVLVAAAIIVVSRSRWRWLDIAHPVITSYVVVVTANHYWLDGVAALAVLGLCFVVLRRWAPRLVP
jgi:PAP2 superfamily